MSVPVDPVRPTNHIHHEADGGTDFVIHPDDHDLFVRTGRQIIDHCQLAVSIEVWLSELRALSEAVRKWSEARPEKLLACYLSPVSSRTTFFFIPVSSSFDFDLADDLAELGRSLPRDYNVGLVEFHQIPGGEIDRFLEVDKARLIYGQKREPSDPVAA